VSSTIEYGDVGVFPGTAVTGGYNGVVAARVTRIDEEEYAASALILYRQKMAMAPGDLKSAAIWEI
jgi:hypothetical protein